MVLSFSARRWIWPGTSRTRASLTAKLRPLPSLVRGMVVPEARYEGGGGGRHGAAARVQMQAWPEVKAARCCASCGAVARVSVGRR